MLQITKYTKKGLDFRKFNYRMPECIYCGNDHYVVSLTVSNQTWRCWCHECSASGPRTQTLKHAVKCVEDAYATS